MEAPSKACWFGSVRVQSFRSYPECHIDLNPGVSVLIGANGAGKTNFLEALSLFAPGKGLRKAAAADLPHRPHTPTKLAAVPDGAALPVQQTASGSWAVSAQLKTPLGQHQMGTGLELSKGERRVLRVDGTTLRGQSSLPAYVSILWLTPRMDGIFVGAVSERRGFLDQLVMALDPGHASELAAYLYAMRERGRLLKHAKASNQSADPTWLSSLEDSMVRHGLAIAAARRSYCRQLAPIFSVGQKPFPGGSCSLDGSLERALDQEKSLVLEDRFRKDLENARGRDRDLGRATLGPHTTDLLVWNADHGRIAADCSTGEQKALLVALLLAHGRLMSQDQSRLPIFLLDEVAAHFDEARRSALFEALVDMGAQAILTGTDRRAFEALEGKGSFIQVAAQSLSYV
ncbi:MAG: DNA replication/repair protein RecF [Alphaproteobacteria bacterium]